MTFTCVNTDIIDERKIFIQQLNTGFYLNRIAALDVLRLDVIHPLISGNKWFKLKENFAAAANKNYNSVLSFGGAWSNHLVATAAAANLLGFQSIGIVRGLHNKENLTASLKTCTAYGMTLHFVSKEEYAGKNEPDFLNKISLNAESHFIISEGGANAEGRRGAGFIAKMIPDEYTHICISAGTGTTLAGLRNALPSKTEIIGFAPMKGGKYLEDIIANSLSVSKPFSLFDEWHFGGFGKWNAALIYFMNHTYLEKNLPLDVVYTSKMMYGVEQLINRNYFPPQARILCIHTGGLQGNESIRHLLSF